MSCLILQLLHLQPMSDNQNDFIAFFNALKARQLPFVMFRPPHTDTITVYQQKDSTHHQTTTLNENGFVFAPFKATSAYTYIPNELRQKFTIPKTEHSTTKTEHPITNTGKAYYFGLIEAAKQAIDQKSVTKVVVSRIQDQPFTGELATSFLRLVHSYPNAMVYFWSHPKTGEWMGASPETLLSINKGVLKTMALAGTLPYTESTTPNWTSKEIDEQQMVTDFIQSQLETVFPKEGITTSPTYTKRAGNLVHLCSDFEVAVAATTPLEIVRLLHPTPAVAGVPVKQSLAFLNTNETHNRSYYAGFFGPIQNTSVNLFVNLRCAQLTKNKLLLYVGGGITSGSNAETEWQESIRKTETLLRVL